MPNQDEQYPISSPTMIHYDNALSVKKLNVTRTSGNPIITPQTPGYDIPNSTTNINGPSLILAPHWLTNPLGKYYFYFSAHSGKNIRLAYADHLEGPWQIHLPGTLSLAQTPCAGHIASPDVHVDHDTRQIRLYYHGPTHNDTTADHLILKHLSHQVGTQRTHLAVSENGLNFEHIAGPIGPYYMRLWQWQDHWYSLGRPANLQRSADGKHDWQMGQQLLPDNYRHGAVHLIGTTLHIFFSRMGDCPEHIVHSCVDLSGDWRTWCATEPVAVLKPEYAWEGADEELIASEIGSVKTRVNQLRDPGVFEEDGHYYLLYSIAGEAGLAIASIDNLP